MAAQITAATILQRMAAGIARSAVQIDWRLPLDVVESVPLAAGALRFQDTRFYCLMCGLVGDLLK
jgi:hypothetical protein